MIIINPGSKIKGGTLKQAEANAKCWLKDIHDKGLTDVVMTKGVDRDGLFVFNFKHPITGVVVHLDTHGFTDEECQEFTFSPRVYWNGSSTANPKIEDWAKEGFRYKVAYFR